MVTSLIRPSYQNNFYTPQRGGIPLNPNLWKGLVGVWSPSLGITGNRLLDQSGFGRDGTLNNFNLSTAWTVGRFGYGLQFDQDDDFISALVVDVRNITAFIRFKTGSDVTTRQDLFSNADTTWLMRMQNGAPTWFVVVDSTFHSIVLPSVVFVVNTWYTMVGTYDGETMHLYLDGVEIGTENATPSGDIDTNTGNVIIGVNPNLTSNNADMILDSHFIWNRVISQSEIMQLHNDPHALFRTRRLAIGRVPDVVGGADVRKHIIPSYMRMCT